MEARQACSICGINYLMTTEEVIFRMCYDCHISIFDETTIGESDFDERVADVYNVNEKGLFDE